MLRQKCAVASVVLLVAGFLAGCGGKPIVGVMLPSTGAAASYGESIESGIRLALADAREHNEIPEGFEVVWADTESDPAKAVTALRRMAEVNEARMVIGGATSAEAVAIIPLLEELDVVALSPSASAPGLAKRSRMFFRIYPSDELEGHTAANFIYTKLAQETALLFTGDTEYTRGILPEFLKQFQDSLNGTVAGEIDVTSETWREDALAALADGGVEVAYVIGFSDDIHDVLTFLHEHQFEGRILTTSAVYSGRVIRDLGEAAEGLLFALPPFDRTSEKEPVVSFVNRYMDTYQRAPDVFAAHGYDAMRIAIQVMTIAQPPASLEIRKALNFGVTESMGVTGPILFDDHGDVKHYPKMFIVNKGQVLSYQRYLDTERRRIINQVQELLQSGE